jgi:predicted RNA-binding protein YlxR (DUF448 family)
MPTVRRGAGPLRRCRVCRTQHPKADLTRWIVQDGRLVRDERQVAPGRGYYSCSDAHSEILPKTIKSLKKV